MRDFLAAYGSSADDYLDQVKEKLRQRFGRDKSVYIQPYRWFGSAEKLTVRGRVLRDNGLRSAQDDDSAWDNLLNSYRRFESDEVANAPLQATFMGQTWRFSADKEGYFDSDLPLDQPVLSGWHDVSVEPLAVEDGQAALCPVLVADASAKVGIISDIDDTILQTHATDLLTVARLTFLGNASMRLPFEGVSELYQALQTGADGLQHNPLFYVSSSPWNLYDLLTDFMEIRSIPAGPLCLRDLGIDRDKFITTGHGNHKLQQIQRIMDCYPDLPFILIGDSGQHDPEIYQGVAALYPGRVQAVYIRDVSDEKREAEVQAIASLMRDAQVDLLLLQDSAAAAAHALGRSWIGQRDLVAVTNALQSGSNVA